MGPCIRKYANAWAKHLIRCIYSNSISDVLFGGLCFWGFPPSTTLSFVTIVHDHITALAGEYGIQIVQHPDDAPMPDMTKLETAFQAYDPDEDPNDSTAYGSILRLSKPIYLAVLNPNMLARAVRDAGRQVRASTSRILPY